MGQALKDLYNEHAPSNVKDVNRLTFYTPRYPREDARYIRHTSAYASILLCSQVSYNEK